MRKHDCGEGNQKGSVRVVGDGRVGQEGLRHSSRGQWVARPTPAFIGLATRDHLSAGCCCRVLSGTRP